LRCSNKIVVGGDRGNYWLAIVEERWGSIELTAFYPGTGWGDRFPSLFSDDKNHCAMAKRTVLYQICLGLYCFFGSGVVAWAQGNFRPLVDTGDRPVVFAPGVVSTPFEEVAATFTPDGGAVYFAQGTIAMEICFSKKIGDGWAKPHVAAFSGRWGDWDPFLSPDGRQLYFVSNRPLDTTGDNKFKRSTHLWFTDRIGDDGWSAPRCIKDSFNMDGVGNYAPSVSRNKDLCFFSPERDKAGKGRSFYAKWMGDHYDAPTALLLNGDEEVSDPYLAPDESYIIFVSGNDLYISYRRGNGWGMGEKLGPAVNDGSSNYDPTVSADGTTLYFTSTRIRGYYKRDPATLPMDYDALLKEMNGIFNGKGNIFMVAIHVRGGGS
jgi:Tol biopolymer transport system component